MLQRLRRCRPAQAAGSRQICRFGPTVIDWHRPSRCQMHLLLHCNRGPLQGVVRLHHCLLLGCHVRHGARAAWQFCYSALLSMNCLISETVSELWLCHTRCHAADDGWRRSKC
jgi:hypothetical protein